ncbi:MAG: hypothetical protein J1E01_00590 [Acetatifactor sp.]|nr:hypothetical protein [Acetatifactor sp.]
MTEEYYETPRDTFLAPIKRKPRVSVPPRCSEEEKRQHKQALLMAAQKGREMHIEGSSK